MSASWESSSISFCCLKFWNLGNVLLFFLFYFELAFWNRLWFLFVWSQQEKLLTVILVGTLSVLFLLLDFTVRYLKHCQTWRVLTTKFRLSVGSPTGERHWPQVAAVIVETCGVFYGWVCFFSILNLRKLKDDWKIKRPEQQMCLWLWGDAEVIYLLLQSSSSLLGAPQTLFFFLPQRA